MQRTISDPATRLPRCARLGLAAVILLTAAACAPAPDASIAARVQALEDEAAIRYLLDHYMDVLAAADWDAYVELFTADAELFMAEGTRKGRNDIKERMATASARMSQAAANQPRRQRADLLSNVRVKVDGDAATARSRFTFLGEDADGSFRVTGSGLYTDTLERGRDGAWRIRSRRVDWDLLRGAARASD